MESHQKPPRYALFQQPDAAEEKGKRPAVRRYSLARLAAASPRDVRFDYLRHAHD